MTVLESKKLCYVKIGRDDIICYVFRILFVLYNLLPSQPRNVGNIRVESVLDEFRHFVFHQRVQNFDLKIESIRQIFSNTFESKIATRKRQLWWKIIDFKWDSNEQKELQAWLDILLAWQAQLIKSYKNDKTYCKYQALLQVKNII